MKRIVALLVSLVILITLMSACQSGGQNPSPAQSPQNQAEPPKTGTSFPQTNIILTVGNGVGSGGDLFCRSLAKAVAGHPLLNGYSIVIENRTGASGANALNYVMDAKPDGYNVLAYTTSLTSNQIINDLPVGPTDLQPLCSMVTDDQIILVHKDSKWNTLNELIDDALANPGSQIWGRSTPSGATSVSQMIFFNDIPGIQVTPLPFDGGGEMLTALLGKHIDVASAEYSEAGTQIQAGNFRPLAVLAENRQEGMPDVPTAKELGYDTVVFRPRGFLLPNGTPQEVVDVLTQIFHSALENEEFVSQLRKDSTTIAWMESERFGEVLEEIYQSYIDINLKALASN